MQVSQKPQQQPPQAFETKGVPHKVAFNPAAKPFKFNGGVKPFGKPHVTPFSKPSAVTPFSKPSFAVKVTQAVPQFPPTPSTIIKPPRFYSNQIFIVPRAKPTETNNGGGVHVTDGGDCICEREDAIIICQKCGSELIGRVQQKCTAHPRKIPLMDHRECLNVECRSIKLAEVSMDESNF